MDRNEAIALAIRLKRATTNRDVIALCDAVLSFSTLAPKFRAANGTFDRLAYQREYMRGYRKRHTILKDKK